MIEPNQLSELRIRPLKRVEYERLVDLGIFQDERIELLKGMLVEKMTQGPAHAEIIGRLTEWLVPAVAGRGRIRPALPYAATDDSEPEPDLAIVPLKDYMRGHPSRAYLVIEVAESSLKRDRGLKAEIYAEAGIPEYWVLDVSAECVHVYRKPERGHYSRVTQVERGAELRVSRFPDVRIPLADLFRSVAKSKTRRRTKPR